MKAKINEIFSSIQGEGVFVGYKQLFIRFCGCNLNCDYCDTEFLKGNEYTPQELYKKITNDYDLKSFHSISLTGGEPLLHAEFLKEFLPLIKNCKIYLETNATLSENLSKIKENIDYIAADIKLESSTGQQTFKLHDEFFTNSDGIETFAKIVFNENITGDEIRQSINLVQKYDLPLILQPEMNVSKMSVSPEFCGKILEIYTNQWKNTRLIPQTHKFIGVE